MADILRTPLIAHLRAEPSAHVLHFRRGKLVRSGRGLAFWFRPLAAGIAEVPVDDREQSFLFLGRTLDFQEVTVQGAVTYRVVDPETLARRVNFGIHLQRGSYLHEPLEQLATIVSQLAQQVTLDYLAHEPVRTVLQDGVEAIRDRIERFLRESGELEAMGLEVVSVRVAQVAPTSELEKALQAPTREGIQQVADEATFQRRALAVEKERAIAENELQNRIELSRREENLIEQQGLNERRRSEEEAEAGRIAAGAAAERRRVESAAEADGIRLVEGARTEAENARLAAYRDLPAGIVLGLAAQELAGKIVSIDHLNVTPDLLGPLLQNLVAAGTRKLEE